VCALTATAWWWRLMFTDKDKTVGSWPVGFMAGLFPTNCNRQSLRLCTVAMHADSDPCGCDLRRTSTFILCRVPYP